MAVLTMLSSFNIYGKGKVLYILNLKRLNTYLHQSQSRNLKECLLNNLDNLHACAPREVRRIALIYALKS